MSDMLDVLHVLFEEDLIPHYENHLEARSNVRTTLYKSLYGQDYKYKIKAQKDRSQQNALGIDPDLELPELPPEEWQTKPFMEATDPEDLPGLLKEAPLN